MRNLWMILALGILTGCGVHRAVVSSGDRGLAKVVNDSEGLRGHDFGLALYDPDSDQWLYQRQSDQYFTPASNTKILTLCTALMCLGDSTTALYYAQRGDTLYFWGAADPSLLFEPIPGASRALQILQEHDGPLYYAPRYETDKFGPGWSWADYQYAYQVERSEMPLYGNRIDLRIGAPDSDLEVNPPYFSQYITVNPGAPYSIERLPFANAFEINPDRIRRFPWERAVPFSVDDYLLMELLRDTLGRQVDLAYGFDHPDEPESITGVPLDTLYRRLMQQSDNFIAEQLLLQSALTARDTFSAEAMIAWMQDSVFRQLPDSLQWFDGSGLSRYNLFTPRSVVRVLEQLLDERGMPFVQEIFPAGGVSGTIASWYGGADGPFVWAKTGTLRNKHCLSGFVRTRSGRTLIFSFMHQNYIGSSSRAKEEMEVILNYIHDRF